MESSHAHCIMLEYKGSCAALAPHTRPCSTDWHITCTDSSIDMTQFTSWIGTTHGTPVVLKAFIDSVSTFANSNCTSGGSRLIQYARGQLETGEGGTTHVQTFLELNLKTTLSGLKRNICAITHWEPCREAREAAMAYVWKKETRVEGSQFEAGMLAQTSHSKAINSLAKGPDNDKVRMEARAYLAEHGRGQFITQVNKGTEWMSCYKSELELYEANLEIVKAAAQDKLATNLMKQLYPWQSDILDLIDRKPNDRAIYVVVDEQGGCGKSTLVKAIRAMNKETCVVVNSGKAADMCEVARQTKARDIILLDLARTQADGREKKDGAKSDMIAWATIEQMKNGTMVATKYQSRVCFDTVPHMILFSNWWPRDFRVLSLDRWRIIDVDYETKKATFLRLPKPMIETLTDESRGPIKEEDFSAYEPDDDNETLLHPYKGDHGTKGDGLKDIESPIKEGATSELQTPTH